MQPDLDLAALLESWEVSLKAERKAPQTLRSYLGGVQRFLNWCEENELLPVLNRATVNTFIADLLEEGAEPSTALSRQRALKRFSAWLVEEGELETDAIARLRPPKQDEKITDRLTEEQCTAILKVCNGRRLSDRRDEAILRLMLETGARAGEVLGMTTEDIELTTGRAVIRRGKGGRGRIVPFSSQTARAIDRYLRLRRSHKLAATPTLWLGERGFGFCYQAMRKSLARRARVAGIPNFHPHLARHTAAQRWLSGGGSEGGLMAVAGWKRREMLDRYTRATAAERAAEEARRLNLGEFGE